MPEVLETLGYNAAGNRIVKVDFGNGHSMTYGLTLCCEASDKGVEDGVACRACYRYLSDEEMYDRSRPRA